MRWMWIDRVLELEPGRRLVAIKNVSLAEGHLHDHFPAGAARPATPVMPASLIIEGMAQSAGLLVGHAHGFREKVVLAKVSRAELDREAAPGDTLRYTAVIEQMERAGASTRGTVEILDHSRPGSPAGEIGRIDLIFSHADQTMAFTDGPEIPTHNFVFSEAFSTLLRTSGIAF